MFLHFIIVLSRFAQWPINENFCQNLRNIPLEALWVIGFTNYIGFCCIFVALRDILFFGFIKFLFIQSICLLQPHFAWLIWWWRNVEFINCICNGHSNFGQYSRNLQLLRVLVQDFVTEGCGAIDCWWVCAFFNSLLKQPNKATDLIFLLDL